MGPVGEFLEMYVQQYCNIQYIPTPTLPETAMSPLKLGHPKKDMSCSNQGFLGAMLVSGRVHMIHLYIVHV